MNSGLSMFGNHLLRNAPATKALAKFFVAAPDIRNFASARADLRTQISGRG